MYQDRMPPHDIEAEEALLGALLVDGGVFPVVEPLVGADDFYRERNAWVYRACRELFQEGTVIDQVTVGNRLRDKEQLEAAGGHAFLSSLAAGVPTSVYAEHYAGVVRQTSIRRELARVSGEIANLAYQETDAGSAVAKAEALVMEIQRSAVVQDAVHIRELVDTWLSEEFDRRLEAAWEDGKGPVPTGFLDLDRILGGLRRSTLTVLAARPTLGKSTLATNVVRHAAERGNRCLVFSLEMGRNEMLYRFLGAEAEVDTARVMMGLCTELEQRRLMDACGALSDLPIWIDDTPNQSVTSMRSKAKRQSVEQGPSAGSGLDLVVVDYMQLAVSDRRSWVEEMTVVSQGLKALARELQVPVLAVSQLSREVERSYRRDRRPRLSDLRDSGAIEQDADVVLFVHRDDRVYSEEEWERRFPADPYPRNIAEIVIAKNRNGPVGQAALYFREHFTRFENLVQDQDEGQGGEA